MKNKHILALFLFGAIITTIGALFKIIHFEINFINGNSLLTTGMLLQVLTAIFFIIKLLRSKQADEFLNK